VVNTTPTSGPSNGTITINADGTYTYTPNANFNGNDQVVVQICDNGTPLPAICVNDTIFITVNPINDGPVVDNETHVTPQQIPVSGDLTNSGDTDIDGNLVVNTTPLSGPTNGTITINSDGTYTYTPNAGFSGSDTVIVEICDDGTPLPAICVNDTIFITVDGCLTNPNLDCDGDGVTNADEIADGTNPSDPCSVDVASVSLTPSAAWNDLDCDSDGLTNGDEQTEGTDPFNPDTDGDGVTDGTEVADGTEPLDPCDLLLVSISVTPAATWADLDCDNDGLTNGEEATEGTDPFNPDTDGDGVTDGTEVADGTEPLDPCDLLLASISVTPAATWAELDCDNDGLTNGEEATEGTDPFNPDTDGDGVTDGTEVADGTEPLDPCDLLLASISVTPATTWADLDCDNDGLTNGEEATEGTDPFNPDTDGDGVLDGTEVTDGTNPIDPCDLLVASQTVTPSDTWADLDCDGDGITNGEETDGGSNPFDPCDPNTCGIVIPEAFTPDGDGINDEFVILGIENYPNNEIIIFNRWGSLVYSTTGYQNDWTGTVNQGIVIGNEGLPTGTYYYMLDLKEDGKDDIFKGYIYLQR
jgi:gliding motility-associated-like protein